MKKKKVTEDIHLLAEGVHPQTGLAINPKSELNDPYIIRLLFQTSEILNATSKRQFNKQDADGDNSKKQNALHEKRRKNINEGKPPRAHFPYEEKELSQIIIKFKDGKTINELAQEFERSTLAIAVQLHNIDLLSGELLKLHRDDNPSLIQNEYENTQD